MLKISVTDAPGEIITLILDGQLTGRWVKLLRRTCAARVKSERFAIDLKNVSFADHDGTTLLRRLMSSGVEIRNALPFLAEQIVRSPIE